MHDLALRAPAYSLAAHLAAGHKKVALPNLSKPIKIVFRQREDAGFTRYTLMYEFQPDSEPSRKYTVVNAAAGFLVIEPDESVFIVSKNGKLYLTLGNVI